MKSMAIACAAVLVLACVSAAAAGEQAVSRSTLDDMGLGRMQSLSDRDALAVRGKGSMAGVWGGSIATWPGGTSSSNNYVAGSSWFGKPASAAGNSFSFGGQFQFSQFNW